jgi:transcription elongation factor GreA
MADRQQELTREGFERLRAELERLETEARRDIADAILEAREHGDLSENAEYHAAKEEQGHLEARIARLRAHLNAATVVEAPAATGVASIGSNVTIRYVPGDETESYQLVGSAEADATAGRLSVESPFGRALLGAKAGDQVTVQTPGGQMTVAVESVG